MTTPTLLQWFRLWGGWYNTEAKASEVEARPELEEFLQDTMNKEHEVFGVSYKDVLFSPVSIDSDFFPVENSILRRNIELMSKSKW